MIGVCELHHTGEAHAPFNAGILQVIRAADPERRVCFFADASHLERVRAQVGPDVAASVEWKPVTATSGGALYGVRFLKNLIRLAKIGSLVARDSDEGRLVVTSFDSTRLLALKLLERWGLGRLRIQVISHGEVAEGIIGGRHRHPWRRFKETRTALTLLESSNIQYLVLEPEIREQLLGAIPSLAGKVEVLDHPLPPNERSSRSRDLELPIRFGFLGLASESKGFRSFLELAAAISGGFPGAAEFELVGRIPSGQDPLGMEWLMGQPQTARLSRERFTEGIARLHFVVMPYASDVYEMTPSGTLLDTIAWQVPIIARRLPMFERLFSVYGDIGYLFDTDDERDRIVEGLITGLDPVRYRTQVSNLRRVLASRLPERLALAYREICARHDARPLERAELRAS